MTPTRPTDSRPPTDSMFPAWVLDVTLWRGEGVYHWCPLTAEGDILTGLTVISGVEAPGPMYAIVHEDGQEAVEQWMADHPAVLDELAAANKPLEAPDAPR